MSLAEDIRTVRERVLADLDMAHDYFEDTDVFRPATGVFVGPDTVRIEKPDDYNPDDEAWEFPPGSVVVCVAEFRGGSQILVARSRARVMSHPV